MAHIDSMMNVLPHQSDTTRINTYLQLAKNYSYLGDCPDSIEIYADLALKESIALGFENGQQKAHFCLGVMHTLKREYEKSNEAFGKAKSFLGENNLKAHSVIFNNIGMNLFYQNDYQQALSYFMQSARLEEEMADTTDTDVSSSYNNIAIIYNLLKEPHKSLTYRKKALSDHRRRGQKIQELSTGTNLISDFRQVGQLDSAIHYAHYFLSLSKEIGSREGIIRNLNHLAYLSHDRGITDSVRYYSQKVLEEADPILYPEQIAHAYLLLSTANDKNSLEFANLGLEFAQRSQSGVTLMNAYKQLHELNKKKGRYAEALQHYESYHNLYDSLLNADKVQQLSFLQTEFETEKKDRELAELAQKSAIQDLELQQKNIMLIFVMFIAVFIAGMIYFYHRQRAMVKKQEMLEAKHRLLRVQMNPHFLFNALSSIQTFFYEQKDPKEVAGYLSKFARLMRLILENSQEAYIPLSQEVDTLRFYLDLQKMRFQDAFEYEIWIDPQIEQDDTLIPPMFAQPFIENSLEHGLFHKKEPGFIWLAFYQRDHKLEFEVIDNGIGRKKAEQISLKSGQVADHKSQALAIAKDRIQLLNKESKTKAALSIIDVQNDLKEVTGTKVTFSLPLRYS